MRALTPSADDFNRGPRPSSSLTPTTYQSFCVFTIFFCLFLLFIYCLVFSSYTIWYVICIPPILAFGYLRICCSGDCLCVSTFPARRNPESAIVVCMSDGWFTYYYTSNVSEVSRPSAPWESAAVRGVGRTRLIVDYDDRGGCIFTL